MCLCGSGSSRSIDLNVQNIPRDDKTVKRAFGPKHDALLFFDYQAIEYRLLAWYMAKIGFPDMAEQFRNGLDPHQQTALDLGVDDRQFGKTFNFASIYGAGPTKIADMLAGKGQQLTPDEAKAMYERFHELRPGIRRLSWTQRWADGYEPGLIEQTLVKRGYLQTLWGRHLHPEAPHKALNALIQGCAADLMRAALVKVHKVLREGDYQSHLVLTVHDELVLDCPAHEVVELAAVIPAQMGHEPISQIVPVEVDVEWSQTTWADKENYEHRL